LESKAVLGDVEHNFSSYNSFLYDTGYINDKTHYIKFFVNLLTKISAANSNYIEKWIHRHINSDLSILRRISIYLINYLEDISGKDKLKFINRKVGIFCFYEKEEFFSVIKTEFPKLTLNPQNSYIKYIMDYNFE